MGKAARPDEPDRDHLAIDYRPIEALIAGSIREYGLNNPVLVDGAGGIIAGHRRGAGDEDGEDDFAWGSGRCRVTGY